MARGKQNSDGAAEAAITIEADVLVRAMKHAASVVDSRNTIPILTNVRLTADGEALEIVTSDLDVEFRQRLPLRAGGTLATTVDAARLSALLSAVDAGAQVSLAMDQARLIVKAGRSRWQLPTLPADDFPALPFDRAEPAAIAVKGTVLAAAIGRVIWSVDANKGARHYLEGPLLHGDGGVTALVATNGHTLVRVPLGTAHPPAAPDAILGPKFCRLLQSLCGQRDEPIDLAWDAGKARARIGEITVTAKAIDGSYPDYRRVIPEAGVPVVVEPAAMRAAIRRVSLVATERSRAFTLEREAGALRLTVTSTEGGAACEEMAADAEAAPASAFNASYVDRMLEAIGGESAEIHQVDARSPALFRRVVPDGAIGVVMPMRV